MPMGRLPCDEDLLLARGCDLYLGVTYTVQTKSRLFLFLNNRMKDLVM